MVREVRQRGATVPDSARVGRGKQNRWVRRAVPRAPARPATRLESGFAITEKHESPSASSPDLARISSNADLPIHRSPTASRSLAWTSSSSTRTQSLSSRGVPSSGRPTAAASRLILEVYVSDLGPDGGPPRRTRGNAPRLIERWVLRHDADDADEGPRGETSTDRSHRPNPSPANPDGRRRQAVAYKANRRDGPGYALCRSLPANRFHRAARQSQCRGLRFAMAHGIWAGEGGDSARGRRQGEKPSGGDFGEYSFTPVRTPAGGSLRATVYFWTRARSPGWTARRPSRRG